MSRSRRSSEASGGLWYFRRKSSECSGLNVANMAAAVGMAWLIRSLRFTGCCSSEDEDEVVLKSSGTAVLFPLTWLYDPVTCPAAAPSLTEIKPIDGGVMLWMPLPLPLSEDESSVKTDCKIKTHMHYANMASFGKAIISWLGCTIKCGIKINAYIEVNGSNGFLTPVWTVQ